MTAFEEFQDPRLVALYDLGDATREDTAFHLALASELAAEEFAPGSILDIGCGTGTITCALARQGYRMTGVDPAGAMLDVARRKPGGGLVRWVEGTASDLATLDGPPPGRTTPADMAIMTAHVAQVISDQDAWRATLTATHAALRPGAHLVFESRNPAVEAWRAWVPERSRHHVQDTPVGAVDIWLALTEVAGDLVRYGIHYRFASDGPDSNGVELVSRNELRFRSREELTHQLEEAGFAVDTVYGDWDRSPLGAASPEMIFIATRN